MIFTFTSFYKEKKLCGREVWLLFRESSWIMLFLLRHCQQPFLSLFSIILFSLFVCVFVITDNTAAIPLMHNTDKTRWTCISASSLPEIYVSACPDINTSEYLHPGSCFRKKLIFSDLKCMSTFVSCSCLQAPYSFISFIKKKPSLDYFTILRQVCMISPQIWTFMCNGHQITISSESFTPNLETCTTCFCVQLRVMTLKLQKPDCCTDSNHLHFF